MTYRIIEETYSIQEKEYLSDLPKFRIEFEIIPGLWRYVGNAETIELSRICVKEHKAKEYLPIDTEFVEYID